MLIFGREEGISGRLHFLILVNEMRSFQRCFEIVKVELSPSFHKKVNWKGEFLGELFLFGHRFNELKAKETGSKRRSWRRVPWPIFTANFIYWKEFVSLRGKHSTRCFTRVPDHLNTEKMNPIAETGDISRKWSLICNVDSGSSISGDGWVSFSVIIKRTNGLKHFLKVIRNW